jgi:hypothetical protein
VLPAHWHNNEILTELEVFKSNQFCIFQARNKPKTEKQKKKEENKIKIEKGPGN